MNTNNNNRASVVLSSKRFDKESSFKVNNRTGSKSQKSFSIIPEKSSASFRNNRRYWSLTFKKNNYHSTCGGGGGGGDGASGGCGGGVGGAGTGAGDIIGDNPNKMKIFPRRTGSINLHCHQVQRHPIDNLPDDSLRLKRWNTLPTIDQRSIVSISNKNGVSVDDHKMDNDNKSKAKKMLDRLKNTVLNKNRRKSAPIDSGPEKVNGCCLNGKFFGKTLQDLSVDGITIPQELKHIMAIVYNDGIHQDGIFRKSPSFKLLREARGILDQGLCLNDPLHKHSLVCASLLKDFLRCLPGTLLLAQNLPIWLNLYYKEDYKTDKCAEAKQIIRTMPYLNRSLLRDLSLLLNRISKYEKLNHMNSSNLSICIAPSLFNCLQSNFTSNQSISTKITRVTQLLIDRALDIFECRRPSWCDTKDFNNSSSVQSFVGDNLGIGQNVNRSSFSLDSVFENDETNLSSPPVLNLSIKKTSKLIDEDVCDSFSCSNSRDSGLCCDSRGDSLEAVVVTSPIDGHNLALSSKMIGFRKRIPDPSSTIYYNGVESLSRKFTGLRLLSDPSECLSTETSLEKDLTRFESPKALRPAISLPVDYESKLSVRHRQISGLGTLGAFGVRQSFRRNGTTAPILNLRSYRCISTPQKLTCNSNIMQNTFDKSSNSPPKTELVDYSNKQKRSSISNNTCYRSSLKISTSCRKPRLSRLRSLPLTRQTRRILANGTNSDVQTSPLVVNKSASDESMRKTSTISYGETFETNIPSHHIRPTVVHDSSILDQNALPLNSNDLTITPNVTTNYRHTKRRISKFRKLLLMDSNNGEESYV